MTSHLRSVGMSYLAHAVGKGVASADIVASYMWHMVRIDSKTLATSLRMLTSSISASKKLSEREGGVVSKEAHSAGTGQQL